MKENEAIKKIKRRITLDRFDGKAFDDLGMAIQALEKQIAKKPLKGGLYSCPNCETLLPYGAFEPKGAYCKYCGQKLDWGK